MTRDKTVMSKILKKFSKQPSVISDLQQQYETSQNEAKLSAISV